MAVPLFDTKTPLAPLQDEIVQRIGELVAAGQFILGPEVKAFEQEFAEYLGVAHVIGVGNGTDAISIALRAMGVERGDEVIVPSFTFYATAEAVADIGAVPVFCDIDPLTRNVSAETVRAAITPKCKAIVTVDLFGVPAPSEELRVEFGLPVLEDAAQAAGATVGDRHAGALGDAATFSFYPSKNLGAFGDGGAIATDDDEIAELARALRFHGSKDKQTFDYVGRNSRLDAIQAAVLRILLRHLDDWTAGRRAAVDSYLAAGLADYVEVPVLAENVAPAWHLYVVTHPRADEVLVALNEAGVEARAYYRMPLHLQPAMAAYGAAETVLPVTDRLAATNIALPISPVLGAEQAREVVAVLAAMAD
jgi:dTDP-3-amino-3,4,6-trideoxy-alpha-D-glucose transaminase